MKGMIVAIAIIALLGFGYRFMGELDHYLYHTKNRLTFPAKVWNACTKRLRRAAKRYFSWPQMHRGPSKGHLSRRSGNRNAHTPYAI